MVPRGHQSALQAITRFVQFNIEELRTRETGGRHTTLTRLQEY